MNPLFAAVSAAHYAPGRVRFNSGIFRPTGGIYCKGPDHAGNLRLAFPAVFQSLHLHCPGRPPLAFRHRQETPYARKTQDRGTPSPFLSISIKKIFMEETPETVRVFAADTFSRIDAAITVAPYVSQTAGVTEVIPGARMVSRFEFSRVERNSIGDDPRLSLAWILGLFPVRRT